MRLLLTFLITVVGAIVALSLLCVLVEQWTSPFTSLLLFFPLFFLTIGASWLISVKITQPKPGHV